MSWYSYCHEMIVHCMLRLLIIVLLYNTYTVQQYLLYIYKHTLTFGFHVQIYFLGFNFCFGIQIFYIYIYLRCLQIHEVITTLGQSVFINTGESKQ